MDEILNEIIIPKKFENFSIENLEDYVEKETYTLYSDPSNVLGACKQLIILDNENFERWTKLGELLFELIVTKNKDFKREAIICFKKSIELNKFQNLKSYWYLGQLFEEYEALKFYEEGLELIKIYDKKNLRSQAEFTAALIELYMTDLCMEANAENKCREYVDSLPCGIHLPLDVQKVSFLLITRDFKQATSIANDCYTQIINLYGNPANFSINDSENLSIVSPEELVNFDVHLTLARIFLDLNLPDRTINLLNLLIDRNENDDRIFHSLANAFILKKNGESALRAINRALDLVLLRNDEDLHDLLLELNNVKKYIIENLISEENV